MQRETFFNNNKSSIPMEMQLKNINSFEEFERRFPDEFLDEDNPTPKKQNNLLNRISITRRWVTVYCPNPKFTKEPSARYLLIITKISIADYTDLLNIGLCLYCTNQRKRILEKFSNPSFLWVYFSSNSPENRGFMWSRKKLLLCKINKK